jgi:hypothetical protein
MMERDSKIISLLESIDDRLDGFLNAASSSSRGTQGQFLRSSRNSTLATGGVADLKGTVKGTAVKSTVVREADPVVSIIPQNEASLEKAKPVVVDAVNAKTDGNKNRLQGGPSRPEIKSGAQKPAAAHKVPPKVVSEQAPGEKTAKSKTIAKHPSVNPNRGPQKSTSKDALTEKRKNDQALANNKGLLQSLSASFTSFGGKVVDQIKEGGGNGDGKGKDAAGLAAGGPLWGAVQEVTEFASEIKEDDSLTGKTATNLFKKFAGKKADGEGGASEPKKDKNGRLRDANGHFIKSPSETVPQKSTSTDTIALATAKERDADTRSPLAGKSSTDKQAEIVKTNTTLSEKEIESSENIKDALIDGEKEDDRRHKQLLKVVAKITTGGSDNDGSFLDDLLGDGKGSKRAKGSKKAKGPVGKLKKAFGGLSQRGGKALSPLKKMFSLGGAGKKGAYKGIEKLGGKGLGKLGGKGLAKLGGKGLGKSLLKKIPGIGLLMGGGFAIDRLMSGDVLGALGELGSGAASMIPGVGTAASVAIDSALMARDAGVIGPDKDIVQPSSTIAHNAGATGAIDGRPPESPKAEDSGGYHWVSNGSESQWVRDEIPRHSVTNDIKTKDSKQGVAQTLKKDKKITLQNGGVSDRTGMTAGRIEKPTPGPVVKPIEKKAVPDVASAKKQSLTREAAQPVVVVKKAGGVKERKQSSSYNIPTEFDDTVLVLMAHDRL